jgi:hypothetical protein
VYQVDARVSAALQRNAPDWRLLNACPCCTYVLEDEPALPFSMMVEMDGNNSLKRMKGGNCLDSRGPRSDYWISQAEVDTFKDEVKSRTVSVYFHKLYLSNFIKRAREEFPRLMIMSDHLMIGRMSQMVI